jgi:hypothetical protein
VAGDNAVAGNDLILHPEIAAPVRDQFVDFFEGAGIEQEIHALAGGQLAGRVLPLHASLAAAELRPALEVG